MRLTFDRSAFAALLAVTVVEALIATLGKPYPLLRGFVGDVVAVGGAYLVYRSFIRAGVLPLAIILGHFVGLNAVWYSFPLAEILGTLYLVIAFTMLYKRELKNL